MNKRFSLNKEQKTEKWDSSSQSRALIRRKKKLICKALDKVLYDSSVYVMPCGTGWLLPLLKGLGYKIIAGNSSIEELAITRHRMGFQGENCIDQEDRFHVIDILSTNYKDSCFDAVILNQDFYGFESPESRCYALREFRRVCSGPIVIPLVLNSDINVMTFVFKNLIHRRQTNYTIPESFSPIVEDVRKSGLFIKWLIPMQHLFSEQWCLVLRRPFDENG